MGSIGYMDKNENNKNHLSKLPLQALPKIWPSLLPSMGTEELNLLRVFFNDILGVVCVCFQYLDYDISYKPLLLVNC